MSGETRTTGTTRTSGLALFWFLLGFTILFTAKVGGGMISLLVGSAVIAFSGILFRVARREEGV